MFASRTAKKQHGSPSALATAYCLSAAIAVVIGALSPAAPASATVPFVSVADLIERGEAVYVSEGCEACHGNTGLGAVGPALAGNQNLDNVCNVLTQLRAKTIHMPRLILEDQDLAAVATYIRNQWGNKSGPVTPADFEGCQ
jgi:cytochrome c oxidase subunit 2